MNVWAKIEKLIEGKKVSKKVEAKKITDVWDKLSFLINGGNNPAKNYPPGNIASWIKTCESKGRDDLAQQIMNAWNRVVDKYPNTRVNWGAATKIGSASVKKNVFAKKEFIDWFEGQEELSSEDIKNIKKIKEPKVKVPAIAIPKDNETPEQWSKEADKTKLSLVKTDEAFDEAEMLISSYQHEIKEFERKISEYDVGGAKHLTKSGKPAKMYERIPKWKDQIEVYKIELSSLDRVIATGKKNFDGSKDAYNNAPVTTVAYEKTAQNASNGMQGYLQKLVEDENWQLLSAIVEDLKKQEKKVASMDKEGLFEGLTKLFGKLVGWVKSIINWVKGFNKSAEGFHDVAYYVGR